MIPDQVAQETETLFDVKVGYTGFDNVYWRHSIKYFVKKVNDGETYRVLPLGVNYQIQTLWQVRAPQSARKYLELMWKAMFPPNSDIHAALNGYTECRKANQAQINKITSFLESFFVFEEPQGGYPSDWEVLYFIRLNPLKALPEIPQELIEAAKKRNKGEHEKVIEEFLEKRNTQFKIAAK